MHFVLLHSSSHSLKMTQNVSFEFSSQKWFSICQIFECSFQISGNCSCWFFGWKIAFKKETFFSDFQTLWYYLVFGSSSNPILVCDQLDQFGLVKKYCFVQRCSSILVSRQGQSFRCQQFSYHRYHSSSGSIMQNAYGILHIEKRFWIFGLGLFENNSIEFLDV